MPIRPPKMPLLLLPLFTALSGAATAAEPSPDPIAFFLGHTEGVGDMKVVMRPAFAMAVHGVGRLEADGTIVVDQLVEESGKRPHQREWRIRATGPGRYAGTLTDAVGPIVGEMVGGRLHLRFWMKGRLAVEQWIGFDPDGRAAHNFMRVRKKGVVVACLTETIRRAGA